MFVVTSNLYLFLIHLVSVTWCEGTDPSALIQNEYMKVSPWPAEITDDGVVAVDHTLTIGGDFLKGIRSGAVMHVTVEDDLGNEVECTNVGVSNLFHRKLNSNQ